MTEWLVAFGMMASLDYVWAEYIKHTSDAAPLRAAAWSVPVYTMGAFMTLTIVHDPLLILPAAAGAFVGTYLSVKLKRK